MLVCSSSMAEMLFSPSLQDVFTLRDVGVGWELHSIYNNGRNAMQVNRV